MDYSRLKDTPAIGCLSDSLSIPPALLLQETGAITALLSKPAASRVGAYVPPLDRAIDLP